MMTGRFPRSKFREVTKLNTASLPDIIFILLFFFMVTTTIRQSVMLVSILPPKAVEAQKLEKKSLISSIYIGPPLRQEYGTQPRIQLNDQFAGVSDIAEFVLREKESRNELERRQMIVSLKVDKNTRMGLVTDVKQELRKAGALKINYSTPLHAKEREGD